MRVAVFQTPDDEAVRIAPERLKEDLEAELDPARRGRPDRVGNPGRLRNECVADSAQRLDGGNWA